MSSRIIQQQQTILSTYRDTPTSNNKHKMPSTGAAFPSPAPALRLWYNCVLLPNGLHTVATHKPKLWNPCTIIQMNRLWIHQLLQRATHNTSRVDWHSKRYENEGCHSTNRTNLPSIFTTHFAFFGHNNSHAHSFGLLFYLFFPHHAPKPDCNTHTVSLFSALCAQQGPHYAMCVWSVRSLNTSLK